MSTYLSCGIIPIYSDCIKDFLQLFSKKRFFVKVSTNLKNLDGSQLLIRENIDNTDIYAEYQEVFETYYNTQRYIDDLSKILSKHL